MAASSKSSPFVSPAQGLRSEPRETLRATVLTTAEDERLPDADLHKLQKVFKASEPIVIDDDERPTDANTHTTAAPSQTLDRLDGI